MYARFPRKVVLDSVMTTEVNSHNFTDEDQLVFAGLYLKILIEGFLM